MKEGFGLTDAIMCGLVGGVIGALIFALIMLIAEVAANAR